MVAASTALGVGAARALGIDGAGGGGGGVDETRGIVAVGEVLPRRKFPDAGTQALPPWRRRRFGRGTRCEDG